VSLQRVLQRRSIVRRCTQADPPLRNGDCVIKRLRNGTQILIRPIRPDDKRLLEDGLRRLSPRSVQRRFLAPKPSFTRAELRYLTEVDGKNHVALVAEYPAAPARMLIGVARYIRLPDDPETAEVAITVADYWQGRGVGSLLAEQLAARARGAGIRRFSATMGSDNVPAHRLMRKLTRLLDRRHTGAGADELVLELAA
jgi:RimJ/RimL family protein N-acetyltransferase